MSSLLTLIKLSIVARSGPDPLLHLEVEYSGQQLIYKFCVSEWANVDSFSSAHTFDIGFLPSLLPLLWDGCPSIQSLMKNGACSGKHPTFSDKIVHVQFLGSVIFDKRLHLILVALASSVSLAYLDMLVNIKFDEQHLFVASGRHE